MFNALTILFLNVLCGIPPIPPIPPVGCSDMQPVCICDENGDNCEWQFVCVQE